MHSKRLTIALAGNPNSGKTTIFNSLTGTRQKVGNWSGVTVEKKEGTVNKHGYQLKIIDLPGTYSLTPFSIEEIVARNYILDDKPDVVIDIIDASNLERSLYLATQIRELDCKVISASSIAIFSSLSMPLFLFPMVNATGTFNSSDSLMASILLPRALAKSAIFRA